jgi:hypothetical protein
MVQLFLQAPLFSTDFGIIAVPTQMRYKIISQGIGAIHELPLQVYLM